MRGTGIRIAGTQFAQHAPGRHVPPVLAPVAPSTSTASSALDASSRRAGCAARAGRDIVQPRYLAAATRFEGYRRLVSTHASDRLISDVHTRLDLHLTDQSLEVCLSLEPIELLVASVSLPQLFGDGRDEALSEVDLTLLVYGGADHDSHGWAPDSASAPGRCEKDRLRRGWRIGGRFPNAGLSEDSAGRGHGSRRVTHVECSRGQGTIKAESGHLPGRHVPRARWQQHGRHAAGMRVRPER